MHVDQMTLDEARLRMNVIPAPGFWVGGWQRHEKLLETISVGVIEEIARSPGGRPLHAITYAETEPQPRLANYNSACAGGGPKAYCDKAKRVKPVVFIVGPVHGHEVEGLTGIHNLMHLLEKGTDMRGQGFPRLAALAARCRLVFVPCGNPDGLVRFEPDSLVGGQFSDVRFWGQGTHADGRFWGWPGCKLLHPMSGDDVGFLGCYFNEEGINPMHDEFFAPMGKEAPAILRVAQCEAPDLAVVMHSHQNSAAILPARGVPLAIQEHIASLSRHLANALRSAGFEISSIAEAVPETPGSTSLRALNLTEAIYHISGAVAATYESPHGLADGCQIDHDGILDTQMLCFQSTFEVALEMKVQGEI